MNRHDRAVAAGWAEAHTNEEKAREDAVSYREQSIRAGGAWAPQVITDWRVPVYEIRKDLVAPMAEDIRRGKRREKRLQNVAVSEGSSASSNSKRNARDLMFGD